jgi:Transcriptional regulator PadR-like family
MIRDFFLGFVKIHILHHAAEGAVYGAAITAEIRRHGYDLSPGTLYPVLHSLERARYLRRVNQVGCYACHRASDKPYLRPRIPEAPEARIINFDPAATWP